MSWRLKLCLIYYDCGRKLLFLPTPLPQEIVNPFCQFGLIAATFRNPGLLEFECAEHGKNIFPLVREVMFQNRRSMFPFMDFKLLINITWKVSCVHWPPFLPKKFVSCTAEITITSTENQEYSSIL